MDITILITALILQGATNIALLYAMHVQARNHNEQQSKAMKAVMSRNINDYIAATEADKPERVMRREEPTEVPIAELTDDEFDAFIDKQNN